MSQRGKEVENPLFLSKGPTSNNIDVKWQFNRDS